MDIIIKDVVDIRKIQWFVFRQPKIEVTFANNSLKIDELTFTANFIRLNYIFYFDSCSGKKSASFNNTEVYFSRPVRDTVKILCKGYLVTVGFECIDSGYGGGFLLVENCRRRGLGMLDLNYFSAWASKSTFTHDDLKFEANSETNRISGCSAPISGYRGCSNWEFLHKNTCQEYLISRHFNLIRIVNDVEERDTNSLEDRYKSYVQSVGNVFYHYFSKKVVINVCRSDILCSSWRMIDELDCSILGSSISIQFRDEEGIDNGGLTREFVRLFCLELQKDDRIKMNGNILDINSIYFCKKVCDPGNDLSAKSISDNTFFRILGKFLALCFLKKLNTEFVISLSLMKYIFNEKMKITDVQDVELQRHLARILKNDVGRQVIFDYKDQLITEDNKKKCVKDMVNFYCIKEKESLYQCIKEGFISLTTDAVFSKYNAEDMMYALYGVKCGLSINAVKNFVKYINCDENKKEIQWLWEIIDQEQLIVDFIVFVTGSGSLTRLNDDSFMIAIEYAGNLGVNSLPVARTCSKTLYLAEFKDFGTMKNAVIVSLKESGGFYFA